MRSKILYIQKGVGFSLPGLDPEVIEKFTSDTIELTGEELKEFEDVIFWIHYGFVLYRIWLHYVL